MKTIRVIKEQFISSSEANVNVFLTEKEATLAFAELKSFYHREYTFDEDDEDYFSVDRVLIVTLEKAKVWADVRDFIQTLQ